MLAGRISLRRRSSSSPSSSVAACPRGSTENSSKCPISPGACVSPTDMTTTETAPTAEAPRDLPRADSRSWIALYVLCAAMLMIVLDATIVNVALPSIQDDLGFSQSALAWVVNAYMIPFGGLLLLAGRLGDLVGQRRVFLVGLTIFTA